MDEDLEIGSSEDELGGLLFGQPLWIDFSEGHVVNEVGVQVAKGWLGSDKFSLGITITGVNDGFHEHGYQEVELNATTLLGTERALAIIATPWTADTAITHSPETYTVCVQILNKGGPLGDPMCDKWGPF